VYFRSRDKDGSHTIRSVTAVNSMLNANFTAQSSIETELLPLEILHCRNKEFRVFFLLWPRPVVFFCKSTRLSYLNKGNLPWPDELYIWTWLSPLKYVPADQKWTFNVEAFQSYRNCLSVCQTIIFENLDVGSSYFHIRCISREHGSSSYMNVIGLRSRSQEQKKVANHPVFSQRKPACQQRSAFPQCENSIANNSASMTQRTTTLDYGRPSSLLLDCSN